MGVCVDVCECEQHNLHFKDSFRGRIGRGARFLGASEVGLRWVEGMLMLMMMMMMMIVVVVLVEVSGR